MQSVGAVVAVARAVQAGRCRQGGAGRPVHASISLQSIPGMQRRCACPIAWQPCAEHTENCDQNRSRIAPGTLLGAPKIGLGALPGRSWASKGSTRHLRRVLGRSWAIPRAARGDPEDAPGPLRSASGTPLERLGDLFGVCRREKSSSSVPSYARPARDARAKRVCDDFRSIFGWSAQGPTFTKYRACQQKQGFSSVRYVSSRTCNATSKNLENRSENRSTIAENRVSGPLGRPVRSTLGARGGADER